MAITTPDPTATMQDGPESLPISSSSTSLSQKEQQEAPVEQWKPSTRLVLAFTSLCVLTLMVALDGTSISVALPKIAQALQGTAIEAFWSGTAFLLASTVFQPSFASLSHIFGRMPMIMVSITLFLIGVLVAALAEDFTMILSGRAVQGIGGGGVIALTEILVTDLVPLRFRGQWQGLIAAMWSLGSVSGPVIGGAFATVNWRWIFWINLPFIGISFVMVPVFLRLNSKPDSILAKLKRVDWVGQFLFVASTTSFLIPLTWGGVMYAWTSWRTLVPLILGAAGILLFCLYEKYVANEPAIRLAVFRNRTTNFAFFTTTLHGLILWCLLYYQPLYYLAVKGYSPIIAGVALFPATFTVAPMAVVTGITITKTNSYRWFIWAGWAIATLGLSLLVLMKPSTTVVEFIFINLVPGVGMGILFPALQFQLQAASTSKDMAWTVAMFTFFRTFGQALGVAIGGVIFQNQMAQKLRKYPEYASRAGELAKDAAALVEVIKHTAAGQGKMRLQAAYTDSIRTVYIVLAVLGGVALLCTFVVKAYDINVELETEHGFVEKRREDGVVEKGHEEKD